uniref:Haloacid dehalogenase-like hydrolase domain-containing protein 3 n=1 Tax=Panagrolaimus sp. PS1159 TaxID=55785 RepID=A0AC35G153_9BILA
MRFLVNKHVKLLSLDAMNTLIGLKEPPGKIYAKFAAEYGIQVNPDMLAQRFKKGFKELETKYPCYGYDTFGAAKWWSKLIKYTFADNHDFGDAESFDHMCMKLYDYYETPEPWKLLEDNVAEHLLNIRSHDIGICITSNFDSRLRTVLYDFDILNHIDYIALSGEIGKAKPDPAIFNEIMEHFSLSNSKEILHIGDSLEKDYKGALDFGAQACLYGLKDATEGIPNIENLGDLKFEK